MRLWRDSYQARGRQLRRICNMRRAHVSRKAYAQASERIAKVMQENARLLRDCKHITTRIHESAADGVNEQTYDQDTAELRCTGCGRLLEDLS